MEKTYLQEVIEKNSYLNILKDQVKTSKAKNPKSELLLISELMSSIPNNLDKITGPKKEMEILRAGIIAEFDAINLYEQLAEVSSNSKVKKLLLDIANEEKTHVGEFEHLLEVIDNEHEKLEEEGEEEAEKLLK